MNPTERDIGFGSGYSESIESPRPFALSPSTLVRCADGVTIRVSGQAAARGRVPKTASIGFSTDALHAGQDSYSPVSLVYFDRAQFKFPGRNKSFTPWFDHLTRCLEKQS